MEKFLNMDTNPNMLSPLSLAFIGDCVYELYVREALVCEANRPPAELNARKVALVNAKTQSNIMEIIRDLLSEEELAIYKRGRNAHTNHNPKNMTVAEYHAATGFECLVGYLYLSGKTNRLKELFETIWERVYKGI